MSDIVEFLRARLDEDEAVAREAIEIRQRVYRDQFESDTTFTAWDDHPAGTVVVGPERVLREVEAKRALLNRHRPLREYDDEPTYTEALDVCNNCGPGDHWSVREWSADDLAKMAQGCPEQRILAAVYADHPDYRDEWR